MAKGQRKQKQDTISKDTFEALCSIQCTEQEIMSVLGVSKDTLLRWCKRNYGCDFATIYDEKRVGGRASLRRAQWRKAVDGDTTLLIWLGKNYLDQSDNYRVNVTSMDESLKEMNEYFATKEKNT